MCFFNDLIYQRSILPFKMHQDAYQWLSAQLVHLLQRQIQFYPGDGKMRTIGQFEISILLPDTFFYEFKVDQVRILGTE